MGGSFLFPGGKALCHSYSNQCSQSVRGTSCCDTVFTYGIKQKKNHTVIVLVEKIKGITY